MSNFDSSTQISMILGDQDTWAELVDAYEVFIQETVVSGIRQIRDIRHIDISTDSNHKRLTLKQLGFPVDDSVLSTYSSQDLFMLIQEYPQFSKVSGTNKFINFLGRVLKSTVTVRNLWTRDYSTSQVLLVVPETSPYTVTVEVPLHARIMGVVSSVSGTLTPSDLVVSGTYSAVGNSSVVLTFASEQAGESAIVDWDAFLTELPQGAVRIDDGGHWFLSTHVEAEFDWEVINSLVREGESIKKKAHDLFYGFAPINLVLRSLGTETNLDMSPLCVCANLGKQVLIQRV